MPPPAAVVDLVERFHNNLAAYRSRGYNEAQRRQEFLNWRSARGRRCWSFPHSVDGPWPRYVHDPDANGIGTVRYPRIVPHDQACARGLKKATLTNLYNHRPTWLNVAYKSLHEALFATYSWDPGMTDEQLLANLLEFNVKRPSEEK